MTKYVLNSGNAKANPKRLEEYNKEIFSDFIGKKKTVRVLMCFFAMPRENWERKFEAYKENLAKDLGLNLEISMALPESFKQDSLESDVIFISGGDDQLLAHRMSSFDVVELFEGKVIATSSAGSDYFSTYFYTLDWRQIFHGSGILPIKFIPHYRSRDYIKGDPRGDLDWDSVYHDLKNYREDLIIYALEEGDFVVIEV